MVVAIDFDGTYTKAPAVWASVMQRIMDAGHTVIMATGNPREIVDKTIRAKFGNKVPIIRGKPKFNACLEAGYRVDIWIENEPMHVHMDQREWEQFHEERGLGKMKVPARTTSAR